METYKIIGHTNPYIAQRDTLFNGATTITIEGGLTLKEAQRKILQFFNEDYGTYYQNWGLVRCNHQFVTTSHQDGTRSYEYDSRDFYIVKEKYVIREREAGNEIDGFETIEEALNELARYEEIDKMAGDFTPDFYEIVTK
jgi:hypothetical protein